MRVVLSLFNELRFTRRFFVQGPLIVPTKGVSLEILLSAVSDCSRIGVRSAFTECLIRHHESPRGLVFAIAVAGCHVSLSFLMLQTANNSVSIADPIGIGV